MAKKHAGQCGKKLGAKKVTDRSVWRDYKTWKVLKEDSVGDTLAKEKKRLFLDQGIFFWVEGISKASALSCRLLLPMGNGEGLHDR